MDLNLANSKSALPSIKVTMADASKLLRVNNIVKSQQDNRDYRGLQLTNGLKVLLISDPATDKAAAAMTVDVGHMSDPENLPGLAHFCEHMLFLGTKKYPNENAYSTYLSENGGTSNASTYADNTVLNRIFSTAFFVARIPALSFKKRLKYVFARIKQINQPYLLPLCLQLISVALIRLLFMRAMAARYFYRKNCYSDFKICSKNFKGKCFPNVDC